MLVGGLVGCDTEQRQVAIQVDHPTALVDEAVRVRVSGLGTGETAVVSAESRDAFDRSWRSQATIVRELTAERDKLVGALFLPPAAARRPTGVLLLGGSDGGLGMLREAGLLASHGYPTISLGYFNQPGLPKDLREVPLEYFAAGARRLAREAGLDPPVAIMGYSRGTEAALLTAQHYPDLLRGVVLCAPSERANTGFPNGGVAWVHNGRPIPNEAIPVDRVVGPVLAIAGTDDLLWPAARSADAIMRALDRAVAWRWVAPVPVTRRPAGTPGPRC